MTPVMKKNLHLEVILKALGNDKVTLLRIAGFDHGSVYTPACHLILNQIKTLKACNSLQIWSDQPLQVVAAKFGWMDFPESPDPGDGKYATESCGIHGRVSAIWLATQKDRNRLFTGFPKSCRKLLSHSRLHRHFLR